MNITRLRRRKAGLCIDCGMIPASPDSTRCQPCRAYQGDQRRWRNSQRTRLGQCIDCGEPATPKFLTCVPCRERARQADRTEGRRLAQGLCAYCGEVPVQKFKGCAGCRRIRGQKAKILRDRRIAAGDCPRCGAPSLPHQTLCATCSARHRAAQDRYRGRRCQ